MYFFSFLIFGILLGSFANYAAAAWAWNPKKNHPWCKSENLRPFWWKIPILGWLGMRREASRFGRGFWIRPLCVELGMGVFAAFFFQSQVIETLNQVLLNEIPVTPTFVWSLLARCAFQLIFVGLMLGASLIDFDEKTIPDQITVGGTLFALLIAFFTPFTLSYEGENMRPIQILPMNQLLDFPLSEVESSEELLFPLTPASPNPAVNVFRDQKEGFGSLASALLCWWGWCFALMDRRWRTNRGFCWAWKIFWERLKRTPSTRKLWNLGKWGTLAIVGLWATAWPQWFTVWSTLLGMGIAGGFMWLIRLAACFSMEREAMGFGDVLLMAMFGAFLGWQPSLVLFFIAPFAGIVLGLLFLLCFHDPEIPFGPFLCAAALLTMLFWPTLWMLTFPLFRLGTLLITLGLGLLLLMVILLTLIQWVEKRVGLREER